MRLNLIVTCLNPAMVESSFLVFKTLRIGFPKAEVAVYSNALPPPLLNRLRGLGFPVLEIHQLISHDTFVETLISLGTEPFWICDCDMVFFDSVEGFSTPLFGGRFEPCFEEEWSRSTHVARLHTCLMYIDPVAIRCAIRQWRSEHVPSIFPNAIASLVRQQFIPMDGKTLFFDTTAGLYHAFSGTQFSDEINSRFEHLHCGSYADIISRETKSLSGLFDLHKQVCHDTELARGIQSRQLEYYKSRNGVSHAIPTHSN